MPATSTGPWYRRDSKAWFTCISGRQIRLLRGPNDKVTEAKARVIWAHHMQQAGFYREAEGICTDPYVVDYICDLFLAHVETYSKPGTLRIRTRFCRDFAKLFGEKRVAELERRHMTEWLVGRPKWGNSTRAIAISSVAAMFTWAVVEELIKRNPFESMKTPKVRSRGAECVPSDDEHEAILKCSPPMLRQAIRMLDATGCRPGELCMIEARHLQQVRGVAGQEVWAWVLPNDEGKTWARTIYLPTEVADLSRRLAEQHKEGPIFRDDSDEPWTPKTLKDDVVWMRKRLGINKRISPYSWRHRFSTLFLRGGGSIHYLMILLGHTSTACIERHYSHLINDCSAIASELNRFRSMVGIKV